MADHEDLTPDTIERLKRRYEDGDETLATIADEEGLTASQLQALRRKFGWRPRKARRAKAGPPGAAKAKSAGKRNARKKNASKKSAVKKASSAKARRSAGAPKTASPRRTPAAKAPATAAVVDMPTLIARIRAQLEDALRAAQEKGPGKEPEETARLMNSLARTLQMLRALEKDTDKDERRDDGADEPPLDLAELRRELARRIDLLRQDREDP